MVEANRSHWTRPGPESSAALYRLSFSRELVCVTRPDRPLLQSLASCPPSKSPSMPDRLPKSETQEAHPMLQARSMNPPTEHALEDTPRDEGCVEAEVQEFGATTTHPNRHTGMMAIPPTINVTTARRRHAPNTYPEATPPINTAPTTRVQEPTPSLSRLLIAATAKAVGSHPRPLLSRSRS